MNRMANGAYVYKPNLSTARPYRRSRGKDTLSTLTVNALTSTADALTSAAHFDLCNRCFDQDALAVGGF